LEPGRQGVLSRPEHEMVQESIQEGIRHILGESGLAMVLSIRPLSQLSADPSGFHEFLKGIFRDDGAAIIEIEIARRLLEKVGKGHVSEGRSFLSRLGSVFSRTRSTGGSSAREQDALRQFLALESVRKSRSAEDRVGGYSRANRGRSFELIASRFAFASKSVT
jgi:hypothetical protein